MAGHYDFIVIGSGAAASSGWSFASHIGKRVAVFEKDVLGGECPTFACVPTKALLQAAEVYRTVSRAQTFGVNVRGISFDFRDFKARKDFVVSRTGAAQGERPYREAGVEVIMEEAKFVSPAEVAAAGERYSADRFLVATGAGVKIPDIPGLEEAGYLTFYEAIELTSLPRSMLVLGGGAAGCEFTELFSSLGCEVTLIDHNHTLLKREDHEVGHLIQSLFAERGVEVLLGAEVTRITSRRGRKEVEYTLNGATGSVVVESILVATGKAPHIDVGLEAAGVDYSASGIVVDEHLMTSNPAVFAAGDCAGPYQFTHAASYQGRIAAHNAFNDARIPVNYSGMPRCVFTYPEVATAGATEADLQAAGTSYRTGLAELGSLGRANTSEEFDGFVKVIADDAGVLLGAAIVAPRAGEMVHELSLAIRAGLTAAQVADAIHAFPTFSEAVGEACWQVVV